MKKILNLLNANLILLNICLILIPTLFYYFYSNKFDTYSSYLTYEFKERKILSKLTIDLYDYNILDFYLNEIDFNNFNLDNDNDNDSVNKFNPSINVTKKQITFNFETKYSKNNNMEEKNIEIINNFLQKSLFIYHEKLKSIFNERYEILTDIIENEPIDNYQQSLNFNKSNLEERLVLENYLDSLNANNSILMVKGYNSKYRRLFLKTDEYIVSSIIILILINILIINYKKILN